ncbi:MAG: RluA family pseudouridine synthase [Planctomycetota bacterium]
MTIVHRDEHLVIVDKPAGVLVVPAPSRSGPTVGDLLGTQLGQAVHAVHRLDEDTTGALAFALTQPAKAAMEALFREHVIVREYMALLASAPSPAAGRVDSLLREDDDGITRVVRSGGVRAVTGYETLERRGRCTLVRCRLETGRRNQIRAHMAALGCPVAGDRKYGFRARPGERFRRVMLHSWHMRFRHPITGTDVDVTVEPSEPELRP